jgi:hypothetical protein
MGTNYYVKHKNRRVCQRDLHIGKNSYGWQFVWQYQYGDEDYNIPELASKQDWLEYLLVHDSEIYNEYDEQVSFLDFVTMLNTKCPGSKREQDGFVNKNHTVECLKDEYSPDKWFVDVEGWSFSKQDFC